MRWMFTAKYFNILKNLIIKTKKSADWNGNYLKQCTHFSRCLSCCSNDIYKYNYTVSYMSWFLKKRFISYKHRIFSENIRFVRCFCCNKNDNIQVVQVRSVIWSTYNLAMQFTNALSIISPSYAVDSRYKTYTIIFEWQFTSCHP